MADKILAIQNAPGEHLGYFEHILEEQGIPYQYTTPAGFPSIKGFSQLIVLGGPMGVYEEDKYPFITEETRYIRRAISLGVPVLGICLGAQLMARALGGRVFPGGAKELGWLPVRLTEEGKKDDVTGGLPSEFVAFHWHGDTFTLPNKVRHLAASDMYENQAFRYGSSYALQFHLEITEEMVRDWVKDLDEGRGDEIVRNTEGNIDALNDMAEKFLSSWLGL